MKVSLVLFTCLSSSVAFQPGRPFSFRTSTRLPVTRVDASEAIQAALEASKKFGPTSSEARVAWDTVEEMNASDNSAAYQGGGISDAEYKTKIDALALILAEERAKLDAVRTLALDIRNIKLSSPEPTASVQDTAAIKVAFQEAKTATETFGLQSPEAKLAWASVEEIASSDNSEAMKPSLDETCLIETIEACEALEELQRAIHLEQSKYASGRYQG